MTRSAVSIQILGGSRVRKGGSFVVVCENP
jgi:hypothetical protein